MRALVLAPRHEPEANPIEFRREFKNSPIETLSWLEFLPVIVAPKSPAHCVVVRTDLQVPKSSLECNLQSAQHSVLLPFSEGDSLDGLCHFLDDRSSSPALCGFLYDDSDPRDLPLVVTRKVYSDCVS